MRVEIPISRLSYILAAITEGKNEGFEGQGQKMVQKEG